MTKLYALIMAGGKGTRFWPESTEKNPKQYLKLISEKSLLAETLARFDKLVDRSNRYIVTTREQLELASEHAQGFIHGPEAIILEPEGRNTGPCILLAMAHLLAQGACEDDVVAVVPSDHVILNVEGFRKTLQMARLHAEREKRIVTIGIRPHFPQTGFGYIKRGQELGPEIFDVHQFKEKPDLETAKKYVASGEYYWNAGMFVAPVKTFLDEFKAHSPDSFEYFDQLKNLVGKDEELSALYAQVPKESIDYAVMEKSQRVSVIPAQFDWNDLGSWDALESVLGKHGENTVVDTQHFFSENAAGNIVYAPSQFVSLINVSNLVVVSNKDSLLVLPKEDSQMVKKVVEYLQGQTWGKELL